MIRLSTLLKLLIVVCIAQNSFAENHANKADSLVDVFPLSIGNQWIYNYDYEYRDDPERSVNYQYSDTGTVTIRIIKKVVTLDSTCWFMQEIGNQWTQENAQSWFEAQTQTDTIQILELNSGNHQLYRVDSLPGMYTSVLPFLPNLADTARVYRYAVVDTTGSKTIMSGETPRGRQFRFTFKQ